MWRSPTAMPIDFNRRIQKWDWCPQSLGAGITALQGLRASFTQTELTLPGKHSSEKKKLTFFKNCILALLVYKTQDSSFIFFFKDGKWDIDGVVEFLLRFKDSFHRKRADLKWGLYNLKHLQIKGKFALIPNLAFCMGPQLTRQRGWCRWLRNTLDTAPLGLFSLLKIFTSCVRVFACVHNMCHVYTVPEKAREGIRN